MRVELFQLSENSIDSLCDVSRRAARCWQNTTYLIKRLRFDHGTDDDEVSSEGLRKEIKSSGTGRHQPGTERERLLLLATFVSVADRWKSDSHPSGPPFETASHFFLCKWSVWYRRQTQRRSLTLAPWRATDYRKHQSVSATSPFFSC